MSSLCCREELRELFRLDTNTACNTADLLPDFQDKISSMEDGPLLGSIEEGSISYVYESVKQQDEVKVISKSSEV